MSCYHPLTAWRGAVQPSGKRSVVFRAGDSTPGSFAVQLPCGQCIGCKLDYSRNWAFRCLAEKQMHSESCFVTLTFDNEHLPKDGQLDVRVFQLFMKKLRRKFNGKKIKFFHAGEYGSRYGRPHYHALLFGVDFHDRVFLKTTSSGSRLYTSKCLSEVWSQGFASVGDVTFESAGYVARYCLKKLDNGLLPRRYEGTDGKLYDVVVKTGEIRRPEYVTMSRGGRTGKGIGYSWYRRYKGDVYPEGYCVVRGGIRMAPPRYFDNQYELENPVDMDRIKKLRCSRANGREEVWNDVLGKVQVLPVNRGDRLSVMENVKERQLSACRRIVES